VPVKYSEDAFFVGRVPDLNISILLSLLAITEFIYNAKCGLAVVNGQEFYRSPETTTVHKSLT
jgi:hypothetical protein